MTNALIRKISLKIIAKYGVDQKKAEELAQNLVDQIEAHGGNPNHQGQTDSAIEIVVSTWLKP